LRVPLITIPSAFEENGFHDPLGPRVLGTIPGSPAEDAGLRPGDIIVGINAFEIRNRAEMLSVLLLMQRRTDLTVRRGDNLIHLKMDVSAKTDFPYDGHVMCKYVFPHGVVAAPALHGRLATEIRATIKAAKSRKCWVITSELMLPAARALLNTYAEDLLGIIDFVVAENEYLGGNIRVLDMCTIGDIASALTRRLATEPAPDLILVSETGFNLQGRDLQGRHWGDLQRWFRIPVRLVSAIRFSY